MSRSGARTRRVKRKKKRFSAGKSEKIVENRSERSGERDTRFCTICGPTSWRRVVSLG